MFEKVAPGDIDAVWPFVEAGLNQIIAKCGQGNWTAGDVRERFLEGKAGLFVRDEGFVVLEMEEERFTRKQYLNVWLMWFRPGTGVKIRGDLIAWLDQMADYLQAEWWEFGSPREGWLGMESGCEPHITIWRRKR